MLAKDQFLCTRTHVLLRKHSRWRLVVVVLHPALMVCVLGACVRVFKILGTNSETKSSLALEASIPGGKQSPTHTYRAGSSLALRLCCVFIFVLRRLRISRVHASILRATALTACVFGRRLCSFECSERKCMEPPLPRKPSRCHGVHHRGTTKFLRLPSISCNLVHLRDEVQHN